MRVFSAYYYKGYGYGAHDEYTVIIIANTQDEALGFALDYYRDSTANGWSITEIDTNKAGVVDP